MFAGRVFETADLDQFNIFFLEKVDNSLLII